MRHCRYFVILFYVGILWMLKSNVFDDHPVKPEFSLHMFPIRFSDSDSLSLFSESNTDSRRSGYSGVGCSSSFDDPILH